MPYDEVPVNISADSHIVVDWNVTKQEYESRLHKSLVRSLLCPV
jgi:hypothetical protein